MAESKIDMKEETNKKTGNPLKLDAALRYGQDVIERTLCPFFLWGQTARDVVDAPPTVDGGLLTGDKVELAILEKHLTREVRSTIKTMEGAEEEDDKIEFEHDGIPIIIKVIRRNYKFLQRPDAKFYMADEYKIPNPFESFWKKRGLVR